jgi:hypothetical protein
MGVASISARPFKGVISNTVRRAPVIQTVKQMVQFYGKGAQKRDGHAAVDTSFADLSR